MLIWVIIFQNKERNVKSETRKGTYKAINEAFPSDKEYVGDYRTFTIQHGHILRTSIMLM